MLSSVVADTPVPFRYDPVPVALASVLFVPSTCLVFKEAKNPFFREVERRRNRDVHKYMGTPSYTERIL